MSSRGSLQEGGRRARSEEGSEKTETWKEHTAGFGGKGRGRELRTQQLLELEELGFCPRPPRGNQPAHPPPTRTKVCVILTTKSVVICYGSNRKKYITILRKRKTYKAEFFPKLRIGLPCCNENASTLSGVTARL